MAALDFGSAPGVSTILPLFLLTFVPLWLAIGFVIALASGWRSLASRYAADRDPPARRWSFQSGSLRQAGYNSVLTVAADREGLYLATIFLFRFGHTPLFIPWRDIAISPKTHFFRDGIEFRLGRENPVPLWLSASLAEQIRQASL